MEVMMSALQIRTTADLREFLLEKMVSISEGGMEVGQAKAVCNFAQQVYNVVKLEMQYAAMKEKIGIKKIEPFDLLPAAGQGKTRSLRAA